MPPTNRRVAAEVVRDQVFESIERLADDPVLGSPGLLRYVAGAVTSLAQPLRGTLGEFKFNSIVGDLHYLRFPEGGGPIWDSPMHLTVPVLTAYERKEGPTWTVVYTDSLLVHFYRQDDRRPHYHVTFTPVVDHYPSGDELADATRINQLLEGLIRIAPTQYMWFHRRFKTQPAGQLNPYQRRDQARQ